LQHFYQVFYEDFDAYLFATNLYDCCNCFCVITTFSNPFKKLAAKNKFFEVIGSLGLLPGFVLPACCFFFR